MKRSDFEAPIAKLVDGFVRALTNLSFDHFNAASERAKQRAAELLREELDGKPQPTKSKPRRAKTKKRSTRTPKVAMPPPVTQAAQTPKGAPRERAIVRCSKCKEVGHNARTCAASTSTPESDTDEEDEPRAPRARASRAIEPLEERVIPHAALVAMLAADRAQNDGGDAGGFIGGRSCEPSLIGHTDEKRELCPVHGWVGRVAFEREHFACLPVGEPCARCNGRGRMTTGSFICKHCNGSGVEPTEAIGAPVVEERAPPIAVEHVKLSRYGRRSRTADRKETLAAKYINRTELREQSAALADELAELDAARPKTRAECANGPRPCPFVLCKHHLFLDVNPETGSITFNFPDVEPDELIESCALDVAERGGVVLEDVGNLLNLTRERARQIETKALHALKATSVVRHGIGPGDFHERGEHALGGDE